MAKYFRVATSTRAVQEAVRTDSLDAEAYYVQAPALVPICSANILVVQADSKGVPVVKQARDAQPEPGKPKGPPKRIGKKKEATVVSVSAHAPFFRTPEQVVKSLFDKEPVRDDPHRTVALKREWATMEGKARALTQAHTWAAQIDGDHVTDHVTLCDGLPSLQRAMDALPAPCASGSRYTLAPAGDSPARSADGMENRPSGVGRTPGMPSLPTAAWSAGARSCMAMSGLSCAH